MAAHWSMAPALDPYALMALISVRSSRPRDICSIGAISGEWLALTSRPSRSTFSNPASSSASAIACAARSVTVRP